MNAVDWASLPPILRAGDLARIYNRKVGGVKKALQKRDPKLPPPCQVRPWGVRKDDCKRHFDRMVA